MQTEPKPKIRIVDIEEIHESDAFEAWGYAYLRVQRGESVDAIRVRIKSVSKEFIDKLSSERPRPPAKLVTLDPQSDEGRRFGTKNAGRAYVPDFNDEKYVRDAEAFDTRFLREVVGRGVVSKLMIDGREAESPADKFRALEAKGLATAHMQGLMDGIMNLVSFSDEERQAFTKSV